MDRSFGLLAFDVKRLKAHFLVDIGSPRRGLACIAFIRAPLQETHIPQQLAWV